MHFVNEYNDFKEIVKMFTKVLAKIINASFFTKVLAKIINASFYYEGFSKTYKCLFYTRHFPSSTQNRTRCTNF